MTSGLVTFKGRLYLILDKPSLGLWYHYAIKGEPRELKGAQVAHAL